MKIFVLSHEQARERAKAAVIDAPDGYTVTIKENTRNLDQNSKLWAMLADVSRQVEWYGRKLDAESWKHLFTSSLKKMDVVPNLDGTGFVALGLSTSKMTKSEFSQLVELIHAFAADKGVRFKDDRVAA